MAVKLAILKSGEDIVADIKELVDDDGNIISLIFCNPVVVKLITNQTLLESENENEYKVAFYPWVPLSKDKNIPVRKDWIVSIIEPVDLVKDSYTQRMDKNGRTESGNADSLNEQYIPDI
jgi:hypothetical protein